MCAELGENILISFKPLGVYFLPIITTHPHI
jgi:hypothetical protein